MVLDLGVDGVVGVVDVVGVGVGVVIRVVGLVFIRVILVVVG